MKPTVANPIQTTAENKSGFFISVGCPGCGGSLELQENFFVLTCPHCSSALRITMPETPPAYMIPARKSKREIRFLIDRHLKEKRLPLTGTDIHYKYIYYPYWKVDYIALKKRNKIIERHVSDQYQANSYGPVTNEQVSRQEKVTDISLTATSLSRAAGIEQECIPWSNGMKTDYISVVPFSRENIDEEYECFPVQISWPDVRDAIEKSVKGQDSLNSADFGYNKTRLFRMAGSIVYQPYIISECGSGGKFRLFVSDAVTGRIVYSTEKDEPFEEIQPGDDPDFEFGQLGVDFHRCLTCGVDLPTIQSYVYICGNCQEMTMMELNPLLDKTLKSIQPPDRSSANKFFPFWSMTITSEEARSLKRMFGGLHDSDRLVIPAFKGKNHEALFRLAKRMSAAYPKFRLEQVEDALDENFLPATVGIHEAITLAAILIHREKSHRSKDIDDDDIYFEPMNVELFYAPFRMEHYFMVDSVLGAVTFEKNIMD